MKNMVPSFVKIFSTGIITLFALTTHAFAGANLNNQIEKLVDQLTDSLKGEVVKGAETQVYIGLGQEHGVVQGSRFEIIRQGEPLRIGDEIIGYEETKIADVIVDRAREKISICTISEKSGTPQAGDKAYQLRKHVKRLVVGQFSYNQSFNQLTKSLQEKLVTSMANNGMQVVERAQLERVLKEQKLGYSGLINMDSAKKIGELLGADGMLLGTINDMGNEISLNGRLVDIESGNTISAAEVDLPKTPLIAQLLEVPVADRLTVSTEKKNTPVQPKSSHKKEQPYFENDMFRIDVISFERAGGGIELKLKYLNKTKKAIDMWLSYPEQNAYIVDDIGNQIAFKEGIMKGNRLTFPSGIPRISVLMFRNTQEKNRKYIVTAKYNPRPGSDFFASFKGLILE